MVNCSVDLAGVRHFEFVEGSRDTASAMQVAYRFRMAYGQAAGDDMSNGAMIVANSGRPGGGIYKHWLPSLQQRMEPTQATARRKRA
ncbi:hypothetical protein N9L68_07170 [bacterium]|nr:hypothetical protein [bacterium]